MDEMIYVRLRYRDILNVFHEDYYEVRGVGGGSRITDEGGKMVAEKWEERLKTGHIFDIDKLTADQLISEAQKRLEDSMAKGRQQ